MELTLADLKSLIGTGSENPFPEIVGKNVFIRTVTYHFTGHVEEIKGGFIKLSRAAWIADSGRFYDALKKEEFNEVEPYINPVYVSIASITDLTEISKTQESQR